MKDDRLYLSHIAECIGRIVDYTGSGEQIFLTTRLIQDAVIRSFEIIGKAAGQISPDVTKQADLPWAQVKAFRNFLIHQYTGVDAAMVWKVIRDDLPVLSARINALPADSAGK